MLKAARATRFGVPAVVLALIPAAVVVAQDPQRDPSRSGGKTPAVSKSDARWRAGERRAQAWREDRKQAAAKARRRASRTRYQGMSRGEAVALARAQFPELLETPLFDGGRPAPQLVVVDHRGRGAALGRHAGTGEHALLDSSLPLRTSGAAGEAAPVDLSLADRGESFETRNSLAPIRIYKESAGDVAMLGTGIRLGLADAEAREALRTDDRAIFANTRKDTDVGIIPQPTGAEMFLHLRSAESPEQFEFTVALPAGATIRKARSTDPIPNDPPEALEVVRGGKPLAYVYPPLAVDADGQEAPSRMSLDGRRIVLEVDHRDADVRYPLAVDPEVRVYGGNWNTWPRWWWSQYRAPGADGSVSGYYGSAKNDCAYYCPGLYQSHPTNTYMTNGSYGYWYYRAPGNTFIYRVQFGGIAHNPVVIYGGHHTRGFQGIMNRAFNAWEGNVNYQNQSGGFGPNPFGPAAHAYWGILHDFCFLPRCNTGAGEEMNYAMFGLQTQNAWGCCGVQTFPEKGTTTMAWSNVYLGDRQRPWLIEGTPGSRGWHDDGFATHPLTVRARDNGLGIYAIRMSGAASGNTTRYHGCTGHPDGYACLWDWSAGFNYTLHEGRNTLTVDARDAVDNYTPTHTWTLDVDRSKPQLSQPSGSLWDARNRGDDQRFAGLYEDSYTLNATASDARSGLRDIEVFLTRKGGSAESQRARGGYSTTGSLSWTMRPDDYADGDYTVEIVARDHVQGQSGAPDERHVERRTFDVTIDRRGDIYTARQHSAEAPALPILATERGQLGTYNARREEEGHLATRHDVACPSDASRRCGEVRRIIYPDTEDGPPLYRVTRGDSVSDPRLDGVATILDVANDQEAEEPVANGPINEQLRAWQTPPPGHGTTYELYEQRDPAEIDDQPTDAITRTYVDARTKLPLRRVTLVGSQVESDLLYTYDRSRKERSELASDTFAVPKPADSTDAKEEDLEGHTQDEAPTGEEPAQDQLARDVEFRRDYGLDPTQAALLLTSTDPALEDSRERYGVPLTAAEFADLVQRDRAVDALDPVYDFIQTNYADTFAGAYIDQQNGGLIYFGFTEDADQRLQALRNVYAYPELLRTFAADLTEVGLDDLLTRIETDRDALLVEGIKINSLATDVEVNAVRVGMDVADPLAEQRLRERYGPSVIVEADGVDERLQQRAPNPYYSRTYKDTPPFLGGVSIGVMRGPYPLCTSGFTMRRRNAYRKLTAGHCSLDEFEFKTYLGATWITGRRPGQFEIQGPMTAAEIAEPPNQTIDAAQIRISPLLATTLIYTYPGTSRRYRSMLHQAKFRDGTPKNTTLCLVGLRHKEPQCGRLLSENATAHDYYRGRDLRRQKIFAAYGLRGDSGGPVYRSQTAYGTVVLRTRKGNTMFTPIGNVTQRYGTRLFTRWAG